MTLGRTVRLPLAFPPHTGDFPALSPVLSLYLGFENFRLVTPQMCVDSSDMDLFLQGLLPKVVDTPPRDLVIL